MYPISFLSQNALQTLLSALRATETALSSHPRGGDLTMTRRVIGEFYRDLSTGSERPREDVGPVQAAETVQLG